MRLSLEPMDAVLPEIGPLLLKHWEEIARYQDIPLKPDFDRYRLMENAGALRIFTIREGQNLVGYAIFVVGYALHYMTSLQATCDIVFVDRSHRRGSGAGLALLRHCDRELADEGVQIVYHRTKAAHDFGPVLERLGYELVDRTFGRRL